MAMRVKCVVPFCTKWMRGDPSENEFVCLSHRRKLPREIVAEYEAAWDAADKAERAGNLDPAIFRRVTVAWEIMSAAAIRRGLS